MAPRPETRPVRLEVATAEDAPQLAAAASLAFFDDRRHMPEDVRAAIEAADDPSNGPPRTSYAGLRRVIAQVNADGSPSTYCKAILGRDSIVGGLLVIERPDLGDGEWRCEGIYVDPDCQHRGIGKEIVRRMFRLHPDAVRWSLGTPDYAKRNHRFTERMGFTHSCTSDGDPSIPFAFYDFENCLPQEERLALREERTDGVGASTDCRSAPDARGLRARLRRATGGSGGDDDHPLRAEDRPRAGVSRLPHVRVQ